MKYLIVGLGNIGDEYRDTRHNIGFKMLDAFAEASNIAFADKRYGFVAHYRVKNAEIVLLKPSTYMNLSGKAVKYWLQQEKIPIENLLVVLDEIALPLGALRMRKKGSDAGHNGLSNIIESLGTNVFSRLRFGIGNDFPYGKQIDYVLGEWKASDLDVINPRLDVAASFIKSFVTQGVDLTMNQMNNK
mgnify:CR=1 FL=1